jgi:hypothetical protein
MALRARPMRPQDVARCTEIIATHPVISQHYGRAIQDLRPAWLRLVRSEAFTSGVFEKLDGARTTICFVGVSVFVTDDFVRELKRPPLFWFGPELARRIVHGDSPVLNDKQVATANAHDGLNLVVWAGCPHPDFLNEPELARFVMDKFIEYHRGFQIKELISSQVESVERLLFTLEAGALLWDPRHGRYIKPSQRDMRAIVEKPHLTGVTRDLQREGRTWRASWVGALFDYHTPRFGFSRSQQRMLLEALSGESGTDQELAGTLRVSLPTIKKTWLSIYDKVAECEPDLILGGKQADRGASERGKEKRRRLLAYLREHPEELRPTVHKRRTERRVAPANRV